MSRGELILEIIFWTCVTSFVIFKFLGKKWLDETFEKRLEDYRHKINALFNRITKIHEKEFEVLPECWSKLQDALKSVNQLTAAYRTIPDLERMPKETLEEFVGEISYLYPLDKQKLIVSQKKNELFREYRFLHEFDMAKSKINEFHEYIIRNKIFLTNDLYKEFEKIDDLLYGSIHEYQFGRESKDIQVITGVYKKLKEDVSPISIVIEGLVQKRLHYTDVV